MFLTVALFVFTAHAAPPQFGQIAVVTTPGVRLLDFDFSVYKHPTHAYLAWGPDGSIAGAFTNHGRWQCDVEGSITSDRCLSLAVKVAGSQKCAILAARLSTCLPSGETTLTP